MTKAQHRKYNQLRKKQVNRDIAIVETSESSVTFYLQFPGLYLTYGCDGHLEMTETVASRESSGRPMAGSVLLQGELGSDIN